MEKIRVRQVGGGKLFTRTVLGLLAVTLWGAGGLGYAYFPRLTVLSPAPLGWAAYAAYGLLTLLPCLTQGWEGLRWVCCKPKN